MVFKNRLTLVKSQFSVWRCFLTQKQILDRFSISYASLRDFVRFSESIKCHFLLDPERLWFASVSH